MDLECKRCNKSFPHTTEYFGWENKKKGILRKYCIKCWKIISKEYRDKYAQEDAEKARNADLYKVQILTPKQTEEALYKAFLELHKNAFEEKLSKNRFESLIIKNLML